MRKLQKFLLPGLLTASLSLSLMSAQQRPTSPVASHTLSTAAESKAVGGDKCSAALGLGAGLAVGALSPCSIVCAVGAWYDLALIAAYC